MNFSIKKFAALSAAIAVAVSASGCKENSADGSSSEGSPENTSVNVPAEAVQISSEDMFTDRDKTSDYDENSAVSIRLNGNSADVSSDSVSVSDGTVTIKKEGSYIISGTLTDGSIAVDTDSSSKVQLILNGCDITCKTSAAIYVKQADKVFVTLASETENTLSTTDAFTAIDDNNIDAVIFSKDDLTFNGSGKLTINSAEGHGIVSKDDLVFTGGDYEITSSGHGLSGKDSVRVSDGKFTLETEKDGVHADNSEDMSLGFIYIGGGEFNVKSGGDGFDSSSVLQIEGGTFTLTSGGGSENAEAHFDQMFGRTPGSASTSQEQQEQDETASAKGFKASESLVVNGGTITADCADDCLHSNGSAAVNGGSLTLSSGDDGIHADENTSVNGGTITVLKSYEGIEGLSIDINGGEISLKASDDGINAAGGNDGSGFGGRNQDGFGASSDSYVKITGGKLVINADGDGVDSNGNLYVSGGETYVSGPTNNGNGALDYNGTAEITGGIFVAAGSSGMAQNFGASSTQGSILVNAQSSTTDPVVLKDESGKEILSFTPEKTYNSVVVSCPEIEKGKTYTLSMCGTDTTVEMTDIIYGASGGMGGGGRPGGDFGGNKPGGMGGGRGEKPAGEVPQMQGGEAPDFPDKNSDSSSETNA